MCALLVNNHSQGQSILKSKEINVNNGSQAISK